MTVEEKNTENKPQKSEDEWINLAEALAPFLDNLNNDLDEEEGE